MKAMPVNIGEPGPKKKDIVSTKKTEAYQMVRNLEEEVPSRVNGHGKLEAE